MPKTFDLGRVDDGDSISMKDLNGLKSDSSNKGIRNEPIYKARRPKIPPVPRHQTDARIEPLFSEPREKTQRTKSYALKSMKKDRGTREQEKNCNARRRRQIAPRVLFSSDVDLKHQAKRVSSSRPNSKNGSNKRGDGDTGRVEVRPIRDFSPEDSSVLARYWKKFKWPLKRRQRKVDYISSAGMWLMDLADQFSYAKSETE